MNTGILSSYIYTRIPYTTPLLFFRRCGGCILFMMCLYFFYFFWRGGAGVVFGEQYGAGIVSRGHYSEQFYFRIH